MFILTMVQGSLWDISNESEVTLILFDIRINVHFKQIFKFIMHNFTQNPN